MSKFKIFERDLTPERTTECSSAYAYYSLLPSGDFIRRQYVTAHSRQRFQYCMRHTNGNHAFFTFHEMEQSGEESWKTSLLSVVLPRRIQNKSHVFGWLPKEQLRVKMVLETSPTFREVRDRITGRTFNYDLYNVLPQLYHEKRTSSVG